LSFDVGSAHRTIGAITRAPTAISLFIVVTLGICAKFYTGAARDWVNNSLSGVFYVIFWCLFASLLFPRAAAKRIVSAVFVATCILEFLQLWHVAFLERLRSFFLGRALLGTSFVWSDLAYYALGSGLGWLWVAGVRRLEDRENL
jgi:hypothetical protein